MINFAIILLFSLIIPAVVGSSSSVPSEVYIGGIFSYSSSAGDRILDQAEHLAAFLMAIREVNNKTDGLYDDLLPQTKLLFSVQGASSMPNAATHFVDIKNSFGGQGVFGVVNSLYNPAALLVNQIGTRMKIPNVVTVANSGSLNSFSEYPHVSKVVALQSNQGGVIQNLFCMQQKQKVGIFVGADADSTEMLYKLLDESICTFHVLVKVIIRVDDIDLSGYVSAALSAGARYFIALLPSRQTAWLLEEGHRQGLFGDKTVIMTPDTGSYNITQYLAEESDASKLMTGLFSLSYWPNYDMNRTAVAKSFAHRWRRQPSTAGILLNNGKLVCDATMDDDNDRYLFQYVNTGNNGTISCIGIDFTKYDEEGMKIQPFTALSYDGTILMAKAVDFAIRHELDYNDADTLQDILVSNVSLIGVSGSIKLRPGYPRYNFNSRGNRIAGNIYLITNFNPSLFEAGAENSMVTIGMFNSDTKTIAMCDTLVDVPCYAMTFASETDGSYSIPPSDSPDPIYVHVALGFKVIMLLFASVVGLLVILLGIFVTMNRKVKAIKASQPVLLGSILLGGCIAAARISLGSADKNEQVCMGEFWTGHLGFVIMIGSLFVKSYRVHCIVNTKTLQRVRFSAADAAKLLLGLVVTAIAYLIIATAFGRPTVRYLRQVVSNQETVWSYCTFDYPQFQTAMFAGEFVLLAIAFRICWEIRNVPDIVNESKQISTAMSAIVLVSVLILPIVYLIGLPPATCELIASLGFGFGSITTLILLFLPKIVLVYNIGGVKISSSKKGAGVHGMLADSEKKKHQNQLGGDATGGLTNAAATEGVLTAGGPKTAATADQLLRHKSKEEKLFLCQEQLVFWQMQLLLQQRKAIQASSDNSGSSSGPSHVTNSQNNYNIHRDSHASSSNVMEAGVDARRSELGTSEGVGGFYISREDGTTTSSRARFPGQMVEYGLDLGDGTTTGMFAMRNNIVVPEASQEMVCTNVSLKVQDI